MNNWADMFEPQRQGGGPQRSPPSPDPGDDDPGALDRSEYRPWILQRGRTAPSLFIDFRRYEPRSGLFVGWGVSYPSLIAYQYTGEGMVSLDFGTRQFVLEGTQLGELARHLQQGTVIALQEFSQAFWPTRPLGPTITSIKKYPQIGGLPDA